MFLYSFLGFILGCLFVDVKDAVIIAGGKGSRLQRNLPKALLSAKGKPILAYQLDYLLASDEINNIVLALGYGSDEVEEFVNSNYKSPRIIFSVESEPLGTAGALKQALSYATTEHVLVLNCDDITDIDISKVASCKENSICVAHPQLPFGRVIDSGGYASFEEKPILDDWVSCGWYFFNRFQLLGILPDKGSLEYDVFPKLRLRVFKHEGFWKTINTDKELVEFEAIDLPSALRKSIFGKK